MIDFEIECFKADLIKGSTPFTKMEACFDPTAQDLSTYHEATFFPIAVVHGETVGLFSKPMQHSNAVFSKSENGESTLSFECACYTYILNSDGSYLFSNKSVGSRNSPHLMNVEQYKSFKLCSKNHFFSK